MINDELLKQWEKAKVTCRKVIEISIKANIYGEPLTKITKQEYIQVYQIVYELCRNRQAEQARVSMVYRDFQEILKSAIMIMSKQLLKQQNLFKLLMLRKIFDAYQATLKILKNMFAFLNRAYHQKNQKIQDLDRIGLLLIANSLFQQESMIEYNAIYFKSLSKIRKSKDFADSGIMKDYVQILYKFHQRLVGKQLKKSRSLYTDFQQAYLLDAKQYYLYFSNKLQELSPSEYFSEVNSLFNLQRTINDQCLGAGSDTFINKVFALQFIQQYKDKLMQSNKGIKYILQNKQVETVYLISNLYKKLTNTVDGFKAPFQAFVFDEITSLLLQTRSELLIKKSSLICIEFISRLIQKINQLEELLKNSFPDFNEFIGAYKTGVQRALARNQLQTPVQQMLAIYVDTKLKVSSMNKQSLRNQIYNIKNIFECLENKDLFLMKYLQKLAKRVTTLSQESLQSHRNLIQQLKKHSGYSVAQKLQSIIDEYRISVEADQSFKQITAQNKVPYNLVVRVFGQGVWPYQQLVQIKIQNLPQIFLVGMNCIKIYEKEIAKRKMLRVSFLDSKFRWIYYFEKQVQNKLNEAYFDTNGVQAILLYYIYMRRPQKIGLSLLFEVFPQIKSNLIKQSLAKMSQKAQNILLKTEDQQDTFYQFNRLMKSKKRIIQYDVLLEDQQQQQQLFQKAELGKQREFTVDANIAKLMKAKKRLSIQKISEEIAKMIKVFSPSLRDIKASIQRLLIKQLLIRDDKDKNTIMYKD